MIQMIGEYIVFWKPFKQRYREFMKVFVSTGMMLSQLLINVQLFKLEDINMN